MSATYDRRGTSNGAPGSVAGDVAAAVGKRTLTDVALQRTTAQTTATASGANAVAAGPFEPVTVTAPKLNVRRTPSTEGNVLGGLRAGAVVEPVARVDVWLRIPYRGDTGFIHGEFVEPVRAPASESAPSSPISPPRDAPPQRVVDAETTPAEVPNTAASEPVAPPHARPPSAPDRQGDASRIPPAGTSGSPSGAAVRPGPSHDAPTHGGQQPAAANPASAPSSEAIARDAGTWSPPAGARLEDPQLLALAHRIHDPRMEQLLRDLGGVLALNSALRGTRSLETRFEVKGKDRAMMVNGIGVVRSQLDALPDATPGVTEFKVAVNHKLEELAPYHFQLNIPTIESPGGWSTCNLTSLAMALEVVGKGASAYPSGEHTKLLAVARAFRGDIAQARLAANGTGPDMSSLMGLRLPDFLELAAVVEFITSAEPNHDEIVAAAVRAVEEKLQSRFLQQLARKFGAESKTKTVRWDTTRTAVQNRATTSALETYGGQHRGDGSHGVEQLSTARNAMEKETDPRKRAIAERQYRALQPAQAAALEGRELERDLNLDTYKSAVVRELGPEIDAGRGVIAGLSRHWTRLYGIDDDHILVQDPGAWNRTEISLTWAEARAMGYFWTNIVIS